MLAGYHCRAKALSQGELGLSEEGRESVAGAVVRSGAV